MKLSARMTVALGTVAAILFSSGGVALLWYEDRDLREAAQQETLLLGRSLQVAVENALRDKQIEDVAETLHTLASIDPDVRIFVYDEEGKMVSASDRAVANAAVRDLQRRAKASDAPIVSFEEKPLVLRIALQLREETPANPSCIVLEKVLTGVQRDLRRTAGIVWSTVVGFIAAVAAVTWLLSRRYVGRPLAQMIADMRAVRSGQLSGTTAQRSPDEVGEAQREFDGLAWDLHTAQVRAEHETEARRRLERGLQHADKLITLGQLSAVMAHEIGSPLQVLEGRARELRKRATDSEATARTSDLLVEQTQRIARIVNQMLSITRRRPLRRMVIDGAELIRGVVLLLEVEASRRKVILRVESVGACEVLADSDQLQQVALNLLRNGLEAAPPDSVVTVRCTRTEAGFQFEVQDAGPGIAPAIRPQLFEPFVTTKASTGGTGLGLSVVKTIVQEHGGRVEVLDEAQGCLVRVTLPPVSKESAA